MASSNSTSRAFSGLFTFFTLILFILSPLVDAHSSVPAPAPAPASDGTSIDQGVAYVLMLVALVLTYLIHPLDASSYNFFLN
ncbi:Arabinogalactan peptide 16 [Cucurbita argyrosperma subsp. argyrosperma]|uniref:arabinogalactan peptide 16-like n=1 Tax=Cucurbita pepo subsp. pepo TaxID=3664 RepID=UPI000C9D65CB|nr:arabinogalactan peptide 16-like [Cucurbita pepo subsp. pepo]KAG7019041.1 Arabinogalactan peptide 16 [Cucurbita argyrosperma subsp. argyrosperma]